MTMTALTIVLIAQLFLIGGLLRERARRRRIEESLRHSEATLRASYTQLRQLTGGLIRTQETANAAVAQDLHDDICQRLAFVSMGLKDLMEAGARGQPTDTRQLVSDLDRDVQGIFDGLRRLSHRLHPPALRLLGLAPALKAHCTEVERRDGITVTFTTDGELAGLHPDLALCVFRIAEEALRNAVVHGAPKGCAVSLVRQDDTLELAVEDDGRGFDVEYLHSAPGLGVGLMHERVHDFGGHLEISSERGRGTRVHAQFPVAVRPASASAASPQTTRVQQRDEVSAGR